MSADQGSGERAEDRALEYLREVGEFPADPEVAELIAALLASNARQKERITALRRELGEIADRPGVCQDVRNIKKKASEALRKDLARAALGDS